MPNVEIPPRYRGPTNGVSLVQVDGETVRSCLDAVEDQYPGLKELILDHDGHLRRFVRLFVNGEAIARDAVDTPVTHADQIQIMASAAGG